LHRAKRAPQLVMRLRGFANQGVEGFPAKKSGRQHDYRFGNVNRSADMRLSRCQDTGERKENQGGGDW